MYIREQVITQKSSRWGQIATPMYLTAILQWKEVSDQVLPHSRQSLTSRHKTAPTVCSGSLMKPQPLSGLLDGPMNTLPELLFTRDKNQDSRCRVLSAFQSNIRHGHPTSMEAHGQRMWNLSSPVCWGWWDTWLSGFWHPDCEERVKFILASPRIKNTFFFLAFLETTLL